MREAKVAECVRRNHSTLVVVLYHQLIIRGHSSTSSTMMQWLIDTTRRYPSAFYREATERPTDRRCRERESRETRKPHWISDITGHRGSGQYRSSSIPRTGRTAPRSTLRDDSLSKRITAMANRPPTLASRIVVAVVHCLGIVSDYQQFIESEHPNASTSLTFSSLSHTTSGGFRR